MRWNRYTIETTTKAEDYISSALLELGIEGVEIEDKLPLSKEDQERMFLDFPANLPPDDGTSRISFYLEDDGTDNTDLLRQVEEALVKLREIVDVGSASISLSQTEDTDWMNNWKQFFSSFSIDHIRIKPTWEEAGEEEPDHILIEIDPGMSFGTGKHETTQLCIRQLIKCAKGGDRVLDIGCGSGILSIVALKLGAAEVVGTDIDPDCMISTRQNMETNQLSPALGTFYVGNLTEDAALRERVGEACYDIVVANILADVIIPMAPVISKCLKAGGCFIASGIIDLKEKDVKEAIEKAGLTIIETGYQGEWVGITARKDV